MIKTELKPTEKFIRFIEPTETHGKLQIIISTYESPVMNTDNISIHSIIDIKEEVDGQYWSYGHQLYPSLLTDKQIGEAFKNIEDNPEKFKSL